MRSIFHLVTALVWSAVSVVRAETYVTQKNVSIDRCGSAWFISRFIDADARFAFFEPGKESPPAGKTYAFFGSEYFNKGADCTFAAIVKAHRKDNLRALRSLNEQFNDIFAWRAGPDSLSRFLRDEIAVLRKETGSDEETYRHMFVFFDLMYLAYGGEKKELLAPRQIDIDQLPLRVFLELADPDAPECGDRYPSTGALPADEALAEIQQIHNRLLPVLEKGDLKPLGKEWCTRAREGGWNKDTAAPLLDWVKLQQPDDGTRATLKRILALVTGKIEGAVP